MVLVLNILSKCSATELIASLLRVYEKMLMESFKYNTIILKRMRPGMVVHASNLSTLGAEDQ